MIRSVLLPILALASLACGTTPDPARPNSTDPGRPAAPDAGAAAGTGEANTEGLNAERIRLYYDLDQYTRRWGEARSQGQAAAARAIESDLLRPLVKAQEAELLKTLAAAGEPRLRTIAARSLGFAPDPARVVPRLTSVLGDPEAPVVSGALASLYVLAYPDTPLIPLLGLLNHESEDVRANGALALYAVLRARGRTGPVAMTPEVKQASGRLALLVSDPEEDPQVRGNAVAALGEIRDPAGTDLLLNLLRDEASVVRTRAAAGLGQHGREQAIPPLIAALEKAETPNEATVITAALEKIALTRGYPVDLKALGADPAAWTAWYTAVKQ